MKEGFKKQLHALVLFLGLLAIMLPLLPAERTSADTVLTPHILQDGTPEDYVSAGRYTLETDGTQLVTLYIPQDGCLQMDMMVRRYGFISVGLHKSADGSDVPTYISCVCTADKSGQDSIHQYMKKGTYYLRFPKNSYTIDLVLYVTADQTLKNGSTAVSYCTNTIFSNFSYKASGNGYIVISQHRLISTGEAYCISVYNSNGKKITDVVSDHDTEKLVYFPVKKGKKYLIKASTIGNSGEQYFRISLEYHSRTDKSGSQKTKATSIKFGKKVSGLIYAEDATSTVDWYKFSNTKSQKISITYGGYASSGVINISILNSKGKCIKNLEIDQLADNTMVTGHIKGKLPKGTYYVKVTKSRKATAGIYSVRIQN